MTIITRRHALAGLGALGATVAASATVAKPFPTGTVLPEERIATLAAELAAALAEFHDGQFKAEVYPANHPRFPERLSLHDCAGYESAKERIEQHLIKAYSAMDELDSGGEWCVPGYEFVARPRRIVIAMRGAA